MYLCHNKDNPATLFLLLKYKKQDKEFSSSNKDPFDNESMKMWFAFVKAGSSWSSEVRLLTKSLWSLVNKSSCMKDVVE